MPRVCSGTYEIIKWRSKAEFLPVAIRHFCYCICGISRWMALKSSSIAMSERLRKGGRNCTRMTYACLEGWRRENEGSAQSAQNS